MRAERSNALTESLRAAQRGRGAAKAACRAANVPACTRGDLFEGSADLLRHGGRKAAMHAKVLRQTVEACAAACKFPEFADICDTPHRQCTQAAGCNSAAEASALKQGTKAGVIHGTASELDVTAPAAPFKIAVKYRCFSDRQFLKKNILDEFKQLTLGKQRAAQCASTTHACPALPFFERSNIAIWVCRFREAS